MLEIKNHVGVGAEFEFTVYGADGTIKEKSGKSPNLVLNQGLDRMGAGNYISAVAVGSGNSQPDITQTGLDTQVSYTTNEQGNFELTYEGSPTPRYVLKRRYRSNAGAFNNDNLTEVSVGWVSSGTFYAWNRALIRDVAGNQTSLTLLEDEYLDVVVIVYYYPPVDDFVQTLNVVDKAGAIINPLEITIRSALLGKFNPPGQYARSFPPPYIFGTVTALVEQNSWMELFDGDIGVNTSKPSGKQLAATSSGSSNPVQLVSDTYVDGSYKRTGKFIIKLNGGNGSIRSMLIKTTLGCYQAQFEPPIIKDNTQELTIPVALSWGRYEPTTA